MSSSPTPELQMPRPPISVPSPAERHPSPSHHFRALRSASRSHLRLLGLGTSGIRGIPADQRKERPSATSSPRTTISSITCCEPTGRPRLPPPTFPNTHPIHHETVSDPPCRRRREEARTVSAHPPNPHRHLLEVRENDHTRLAPLLPRRKYPANSTANTSFSCTGTWDPGAHSVNLPPPTHHHHSHHHAYPHTPPQN